MQVNINRENTINNFATRDITNINADEFNEIVLCLKIQLETLEEKFEQYKNAKDKRLREFIPRKEKEIEQLKKLLKTMQ